MEDFVKGIFVGLAIAGMAVFLYVVFSEVVDNSGYNDKLVIEYHCPDREYNRDLIHNMMEVSGIQTNFLNKEFTMDKYHLKYRFTNPDR